MRVNLKVAYLVGVLLLNSLRAQGGDSTAVPVNTNLIGEEQKLVRCEKTLKPKGKDHLRRSKPNYEVSPESTRGKALAVAPKFFNYFDSASKQILEREYVLEAMMLAWIAKEHILLVGPPGNAKTTLVKTLMKNVRHEMSGSHSFFSHQVTPETTLSDTHGPLNFKGLEVDNVYERLYDSGMLNHHFNLLDETFDGRPGADRNILDVLAERSHSSGKNHHQGKIWTVVGVSNTFIPEVYLRHNLSDKPRALIDRYAFALFIPAEMELIESQRAIGQNQIYNLPPLTFEDIEKIQALVKEVEVPDYILDLLGLIQYQLRPILETEEETKTDEYYMALRNGDRPLPPYRSTKYMSPRTYGKESAILRAIVVINYLKSKGQRPLIATLEDLYEVQKEYALNGPSDDFIEEQMSRASKKMEKEQLRILQYERGAVKEVFDSVIGDFKKKVLSFDVVRMQREIDRYASLHVSQRRLLMDTLKKMYQDGRTYKTGKLSGQTSEKIALMSMMDFVVDWLKGIVPQEQAATILKRWDREMSMSPSETPPVKINKAAARYWRDESLNQRQDGQAIKSTTGAPLTNLKKYEKTQEREKQVIAEIDIVKNSEFWEIPLARTEYLKPVPNSDYKLLGHHIFSGLFFEDEKDLTKVFIDSTGQFTRINLGDLELGKDIQVIGPFLKEKSKNDLILIQSDRGLEPDSVLNWADLDPFNRSKGSQLVAKTNGNPDPRSTKSSTPKWQKWQKIFVHSGDSVYGIEKSSGSRPAQRTEILPWDVQTGKPLKSWNERTTLLPYSTDSGVLVGASKKYNPYDYFNIGPFTVMRERYGQTNPNVPEPLGSELILIDHNSKSITATKDFNWLMGESQSFWFIDQGRLQGYKYVLVDNFDTNQNHHHYSISFKDRFERDQLWIPVSEEFSTSQSIVPSQLKVWFENGRIHVAGLLQNSASSESGGTKGGEAGFIFELVYSWSGAQSTLEFKGRRIYKLPDSLLVKGVHLDVSESNVLFLHGNDTQKRFRVFLIQSFSNIKESEPQD